MHNLFERHADVEGVALDVRSCRNGDAGGGVVGVIGDNRRVGGIDEGETDL